MDDPYEFSRVLGIQKISYFAFADVVVLILLFFHRSILWKLGLWRNYNIQDLFSYSTKDENLDKSVSTSLNDNDKIKQNLNVTKSLNSTHQNENLNNNNSTYKDIYAKSTLNNRSLKTAQSFIFPFPDSSKSTIYSVDETNLLKQNQIKNVKF